MYYLKRIRNNWRKLIALIFVMLVGNTYFVSKCFQFYQQYKTTTTNHEDVKENACVSIYDPRNKCPNVAPVPVNETLLRSYKCNNCTPTVFEYLGDSVNKCRSHGSEDILIFIFSSKKDIAYKHRRRMVRKTWGSNEQQSRFGFRLLFLIGRYKNMSNDKLQPDEIMVDMEDEYRNLTYKTISMFHFVLTFCHQFKYIVKTDDDTVFNIPMLRATITETDMRNQIIGHCFIPASPPLRDPSNPYHVTYKEYPFNFYPHYCSGSGYVMHQHTLAKIYKTMPNVPLLAMEDVFVGISAFHASISLVHSNGFWAFRIAEGLYEKTLQRFCYHIVLLHYITPEEGFQIWTRYARHCKNMGFVTSGMNSN